MMRGSMMPRWVAPLAAFIAVVVVHMAWTALFPDQDPAQARWAGVGPTWTQRYFGEGDYFLSLSYALPAAFAVWAFRRWRDRRKRAAGLAALGGTAVAGSLAAAGCFLVGCCGSPMLAIYLNLFGVAFLPFAKPLLAAVTALSTIASWLWLEWRLRSADVDCNCDDEACRPPAAQSRVRV